LGTDQGVTNQMKTAHGGSKAKKSGGSEGGLLRRAKTRRSKQRGGEAAPHIEKGIGKERPFPTAKKCNLRGGSLEPMGKNLSPPRDA